MRGQGAYFWCMFDYLFGETDTFDLNYYIFLINQQPTSKKLQLFGFLPFSHVQIAFIELLPCNLQKVFFCEISLQLRYQISSAPSVIDPFFLMSLLFLFPFRIIVIIFSVYPTGRHFQLEIFPHTTRNIPTTDFIHRRRLPLELCC